MRDALGAFAVGVEELPAYEPRLKGTVEALNVAAEAMLFSVLPCYTHAPTLTGGRRPGAAEPP
ncbi:hypothetical protein LP52_23255 [Streptomonospora alba]|uniref:Uncharacterized protein n=1 Tax=Streptomonospora alba TaxID=183763 RepID=A0A0C2G0B3_9ACTN|nr:hypothetical protein [Streptomonospora alba]KIH96738.1 hypothetical protein LP52_23255 [Streptomonospora alba]